MAIASLFGVVALPIILIGVLLPVALVVALQVWLCKRKNRWLGLILPGLSLLVGAETFALMGVNFLINNIPTVVLGGIWLHYKNRRDFQSELNKMNIQDLE